MMWPSRWAKVAQICAYAVGVGGVSVGNFILMRLEEHTALTFILVLMLAPFTLAMALTLAAFVACSVLSLALSDGCARAELLVNAIGGMQPPSAGERYREAMLADIRVAPPNLVRAIGINLMTTAPRTVLEAWVHVTRPLRERTRNVVGSSTEHPGL